jgi:hypothetical protein
VKLLFRNPRRWLRGKLRIRAERAKQLGPNELGRYGYRLVRCDKPEHEGATDGENKHLQDSSEALVGLSPTQRAEGNC